MATRRRKPPKKDLTDLKARLGLERSLEKRPEEPPPQAAPVNQGEVTVNQGMPMGGQPQGYQGGMPPGQPHFPGQPGPARPPFAGPPGGVRRPPKKPVRKKPTWEPPPSDPNAALDVQVKTPRSLGQILAAVVILGVVAIFFSGIGFFFGNARQQRGLYDAQSGDAKRVLEVVEPKVKKVLKLQAAASKHDGLAPDAEVLEALSELDFVLEPEEFSGDKLLLGPEITTLLMRFSADTKYIAASMKRHQIMTGKVDKKELEDLSKANDALKAAGFAVIFDAGAFSDNFSKKGETRPLEGRLMSFDNFDTTDKDGDKLIKIRSPSTGQERDWSLKKLVLLDKKEMLKSSGPNALRRYERRHKEIDSKLKEVSQYSEGLITELDKLGNRPSAPLLSF